MLLRFIFTCTLLLISSSLYAQNDADDILVGEINGEGVTYNELKDNFLNSGKQEYNLDELKEFLPLYLNYRAKLLDAKRLGYYDVESIQEEHELYSKQASYNYWLDQQIRPDLFEKYFERSKYELKASHILISPNFDQNIDNLDQALEKALEARQRLLNGDEFEQINAQYSSSRNGQNMGGSLPWLSVGTTVGPFEDALYSLEEGEISEPVETQFGIHVIRLEEIREKVPPRRTQHIFVRPTRDSTAQIKVYEVYKALQEGRQWKEVVSEYSEDETTKFKAGDIGWISYGTNYAASFIDNIMNLNPEKAYSEPFRSPYGYHIIRIDSVQSFSSEESRKEQLQEEFDNTPYFKRNNTFVINYLRDYYGDDIKNSVLGDFENYIITQDSVLISEFDLPESISSSIIYTFNEVNFSGNDYLDYLKESRGDRYRFQYTRQWFNNYLQDLIDKRILNLTLDEFPEFQEQTDNYMDGLVIYQINNDYMWSGETVDINELLKLYLNNINNYRLEERAYYHLITSQTDSALQKGVNFINDGNSPDSLRSNISGIAVNIDSTNTFTEPPFDRLLSMEPGSFTDTFSYRNRVAVLYLNEILPSRTLSFEEAFDRLLTDYQPTRERIWLERLKEKYNISFNMTRLEEAYNLENSR
ncbi:peptidylprolyl isomerase [Balneola sp. MJW-20]|uniref:peptidylprolyl isomerase n=1 Tax=Gracilimonas aurantiaca TaxID=3234185 RepID=UPI003465A947